MPAIFLLLLLCLFVFAANGLAADRPRLSRQETGALTLHPPREGVFNTTLNHFDYSDNSTFPLRYLVYDDFLKRTPSRPTTPVLFYCGNEGDIYDFYNATGYMFELGEEIGALIVFLEHRYYGLSLPFGDASYQTQNLRFLTIEHALADFSLFLGDLQRVFDLTSPPRTVLFGGSYGGMLAAWHRVKASPQHPHAQSRACQYPHLSAGALAASAPVNLYPGQGRQQLFYEATLHTFNTFGNSSGCVPAIEAALRSIMSLAPSPANLTRLGNIFNVCDPLSSLPSPAEKLEFYIKGALATMAMLDYPYPCNFVTPMPANPVATACARLELGGGDVWGQMAALNEAVDVFVNFTGALTCKDVGAEVVGPARKAARQPTQRSRGLGDISIPWNYQTCAELILEPLTSNGFGFYTEDDDQVGSVTQWCLETFGVHSRPSWIRLSMGLEANATAFLTNVLFTDGEKDPWRVGNIGQSKSPSVETRLIAGAAHHQDLRFTDPRDPPSLIEARQHATQRIKQWLEVS